MVLVKYTCVCCGTFARPVPVRFREDGEDVVDWVRNVVVPALREDHQQFRPFCISKQIDKMSIPYSGTGPVGVPPTLTG